MKQHNAAIYNIRAFNRFYTNIIGFVNGHILESTYSLTEVRILYELYHNKNCTARMLKSIINIDEGYLSRTIDKMVNRGLIRKKQSIQDGRAYLLALTPKGRNQFEGLNEASDRSITALIEHLSPVEAKELTALFFRIQQLLTKSSPL